MHRLLVILLLISLPVWAASDFWADNIVAFSTLQMYNTAKNKKIAMSAPTLTSGYNLIWPYNQGSASSVLSNDGSGNLSWVPQTSSITAVQQMGSFGSAPNANGALISGSTLTLEPTDGTFPGGLSTGAQTIGGQKTFSTGLTGTLTGYATLNQLLINSQAAPANQAFTGWNGTAFSTGTFGSGNGTVTGVSVIAANGFAGQIAKSTTIPEITMKTTITGLLKGSGNALVAATSGSDYAPATTGSSVLSGNGAGGFTNNQQTGSGSVVLNTSPVLVTPTLGAATATTVNKITLTQPTSGATLTVADGKTLTSSNTLTFAGTDGSSLNIGTGGTLGSLAYSTAGSVFAKYTAPSTPVGTGANAMSIDWAGNDNFTKTLTANSTVSFTSVTVPGETIIVRLTNTASNYTVTWPTTSPVPLCWAGGTALCNGAAPTMTTGAHADVYVFYYDGSSIFGTAVQGY